MQFLTKLEPKIYLTGAMVLGFFQVIDGALALNGFRNNVTTAFSLLELIWFLVSLMFVLAFQKKQLHIFVPLIYIIYYSFTWLYASYLLTQKDVGESLQLPVWLMWLATTFGALYCASAYKTYKHLE